MKADTLAKLIVLETLLDAEMGHYLEHHPPADLFREGLVARVSELVDRIDALDAAAAAHIYDALVDFLAELPQEAEEGDERMVGAAVRLKRATDRLIERGMRRRELNQAATWAVVLDELLEALAAEYRRAVPGPGELLAREYMGARLLLARSREAADRMLWRLEGGEPAELRSDLDRLSFAVRHQRPSPAAIEILVRAPQRYARKHRPSSLTRVGGFVLGQLLRRNVRSA